MANVLYIGYITIRRCGIDWNKTFALTRRSSCSAHILRVAPNRIRQHERVLTNWLIVLSGCGTCTDTLTQVRQVAPAIYVGDYELCGVCAFRGV